MNTLISTSVGSVGSFAYSMDGAQPRNAVHTANPLPQVVKPATDLPSSEQLIAAVNQLANAVQTHASSLRFTIDTESGKTVVNITDAQTGEMIRQIPSKEMLAIAKSIDQAQGLLVRQKV